MHYDHRGNFDIFPNAKFYASEQEIDDFRNNKLNIGVNGSDVVQLARLLNPLPQEIEGIKVISAPGHTRGSVLLFHQKLKILFTGDTYFREGICGRTDLETSNPDKMSETLKKIKKIEYDILCPGHDY